MVRDALVRGTVRDVAKRIHLSQHVTGFVRRSRSTRAASAFRNVRVFDARGHQDTDVPCILHTQIVVWSADGWTHTDTVVNPDGKQDERPVVSAVFVLSTPASSTASCVSDDVHTRVISGMAST